MVNNGNKNCGFDDAMVSYMYDEIDAGERRKFETHLVDCAACTEEFAEISGARFSIYEWQKEAFAELPTPEIVIPYAKTRRAEVEEAGFFAGLRGLLGGYGIPVSAMAAILICLGLGFTVFTAMDRGDDDVIADVAPIVTQQQNPPQNSIAEKPVIDEAIVIGNGEVRAADGVKASDPVLSDIKPIKTVVESKRSRPQKQLTAETVLPNRRDQRTAKKAPALSNFEEADDRSLRLTDLFDDEIGSIR